MLGIWRMDLKRFPAPLLVIVGDEDDTCIEGSVFLKATVPAAGFAGRSRAPAAQHHEGRS